MDTQQLIKESERVRLALEDILKNQKSIVGKLRESEKRFRSLYENIPLPYQSLDTDGCLVDVNPVWLDTLGYKREEVIGKHFSEFLTPASAEIMKERFPRFKAEGEIHSAEFEMVRKDGSKLFVSFKGKNSNDELGNFKQTQCIFTDITENKRTEEKILLTNKRFNYLLSSTTAVIYAANPSGDYGATFVSENIFQLTGYKPNNFIEESSFWFNHVHTEDQPKIEKEVSKIFEEDFHVYEYRFHRKDGIYIWIHDEMRLIRDDKGEPLEIVGFWSDITGRKRTEEVLHKSKETTEDYLNIAAEIIISLDARGDITLLNESGHRLLGYEKGELAGKNWFENCIPKELRREVAGVFQKLIHGEINNVTTYENSVITKTGEEKIILWHNTLLKNDDGRIIGTLSSGEDITRRKHAEEALRKSVTDYKRLSNEFQALLDAIPDNLTLLSPDLKIIWANKGAAQGFGLTTNDLIGKYCYNLWQKRTEPYERCPVQRSFITGKPENEEFVAPDGRFWDLRTVPIKEDNGNIISVIEVGRDITERKIAENKLRQSEERFSIIFKTSPFAITLTTITEGRFIDVNDSFLHLTGHKRDEVINSTIADLKIWVNPDERTQMLQQLYKEGYVNNFELIYNKKSGEHRIALASVSVLDIDEAKCLLAFFYDITDRKRAEEALRESESKFRTVADTSVAAIFIYQGDKFIYMNPASEDITGFNQSELLSIQFWDIIHPEFREKVKERGLARQRGEAVPSRYEFKIIRKDGEERWIDFGAGAIHLEGKPAALGIAFDITERKRAEKELQSSYKQMRQLMARMQAIREEESSRIAREIHDELGQTLTGIKMDLSFLEERLSEKINLSNELNVTSKINSISNLADSAIQTIRKITTELRPAILDSMGLVAAIEWQAEEFEKRTGIRCSYSSEVENVELDRDHSTAIFRILQESLTNITRHAKATKVSITLKREFKNLVMEIIDNGRGIATNELNKINTFGILGMKERAAFLGGKCEVQGAPNQGTTIRVSVPH